MTATRPDTGVDHTWLDRGLGAEVVWGEHGNRAAARMPGGLVELRLVFSLTGHDRTAARVVLTALRTELAALAASADTEFVEGNDRVTLAVRCADDDLRTVATELGARLAEPHWLTERAVAAATGTLLARARRAAGDRGAAVRTRFLSQYAAAVPVNLPLAVADLETLTTVDPTVLVPPAGAVVGVGPVAESLALLDPLVAAPVPAPVGGIVVPPTVQRVHRARRGALVDPARHPGPRPDGRVLSRAATRGSVAGRVSRQPAAPATA